MTCDFSRLGGFLHMPKPNLSPFTFQVIYAIVLLVYFFIASTTNQYLLQTLLIWPNA
jgi:hypothetical protein